MKNVILVGLVFVATWRTVYVFLMWQQRNGRIMFFRIRRPAFKVDWTPPYTYPLLFVHDDTLCDDECCANFRPAPHKRGQYPMCGEAEYQAQLTRTRREEAISKKLYPRKYVNDDVEKKWQAHIRGECKRYDFQTCDFNPPHTGKLLTEIEKLIAGNESPHVCYAGCSQCEPLMKILPVTKNGA